MGEPDIRWDGVPHEQIERWTRYGCGAAVTEKLEARLAAVTEVLDDIADDVTATLRRVDGGEWSGSTAAAAATAMRAVRDFDDTMGHHGRMNVLAAFGQSDNATWARANVPPYVDVRAARVPTGTPLDAVNATADHHQELQAAKDAEERARQVMRQYQVMTTTRIAAFPALSPAPRVVVATDDGITVPPGGGDAPGGAVAPRRARSADGGPHPAERPRDPAPDNPDGPTTTPATPAAPPTPPTTSPTPATALPTTLPAGRTGPAPSAPDTALSSTPTPTPTSATSMSSAAAGTAPQPDPGVVAGPLPGRGRQGGGLGGGHVGSVPTDTPGRGGRTEAVGQAVRGAGPFGLAPGATRKEEDEERRGRYAVPGSEIFEPDNDDGLLHDPFRPGSYVAPASIGDDDE